MKPHCDKLTPHGAKLTPHGDKLIPHGDKLTPHVGWICDYPGFFAVYLNYCWFQNFIQPAVPWQFGLEGCHVIKNPRCVLLDHLPK